jgi:hypothetical protein
MRVRWVPSSPNQHDLPGPVRTFCGMCVARRDRRTFCSVRTKSLTAAWFVTLVLASGALAATSGHVVEASGVRVVVPSGWQRVLAANTGGRLSHAPSGRHPGVRPKPTLCHIAAYRVPADGALVVVVGWKSRASAGGGLKNTGLAPLRQLLHVRRPSFECFSGRGAVTSLVLGPKPYQVNVLVGSKAPKRTIAAALAVGRSFRVTR